MSKPTPEDFFNAYINHQEEAGMPVCKDTIVALMLRHAAWLAQEAKRFVDVQSWKDFAKTGTLDLDGESDVGMDELEIDRLVRPISKSPATLTLLPGHRRVRPLAQLQDHLFNPPCS
jgi:hypothetical protein